MGSAKIKGIPKSINATDMANIGAGGADLVSKTLFFEAMKALQIGTASTGAGVSINELYSLPNQKVYLYNGVHDSLILQMTPELRNFLEKNGRIDTLNFNYNAWKIK